MFYPEWYEAPISACMECGTIFEGDPADGEVGQPGEPGHAFLCPSCYAKHPEGKARLTLREPDESHTIPGAGGSE